MEWIWTIGLNGGLGLGAYGVARDAFGQPAGMPRALAAAVLAWAWATLGTLGLGLVGELNRPALLGWVALGLALAGIARLRRRRRPVAPGADQGGPGGRGGVWDLPATLALGLTLWAVVVLGAPALLLPPKVVSDGPIYHLYFAARWWQAGRILPIAAPFGENAATYFPAGGEVWFAWLLTCWDGPRLAQVGQAPFLLLAGAAAFGLARRLGAGPSAALLATTFLVTSVPLLLFSFEGNVDTLFVAGYLVAVYFGLRFALRDGGAGTLALGSLAAGMAWGTKPTGTVFVPVLLALGAAVVLGRRDGWPARLGHLALLVLLPLVGIGYWYGRNLALTGNPLYPLQVELFGRVLLPGGYVRDAMRWSPYFLPRENWRALVDILVVVLDPRLVPFWLVALLGGWAVGRRRQPLDRWVWALAALAVLNVALYWLLIPYRTQQRFMLHALGLGAVPLARLLDRGSAVRWLAAGALAAHLLTAPSWPLGWDWRLGQEIPVATRAVLPLPQSWDAWKAAFSPEGGQGLYLVLTLSYGAGALLVAAAWRWATASGRPGRVAVALALSLALAGAALAVTWWGLDARRARLPVFPDYQRAWQELLARSGPEGVRIAYAGTNIPYYLMAPDLRNEVRYVNIDVHRDWLLHDYHRAAIARGEPALWPTPRPGWDRLRPDYDAWLANLRAAGIQTLVVARARPEDGPFNVADALGFPIERTWAETHPESFEPIYGVVEADPEMRLYRLRPPAPR